MDNMHLTYLTLKPRTRIGGYEAGKCMSKLRVFRLNLSCNVYVRTPDTPNQISYFYIKRICFIPFFSYDLIQNYVLNH